MIYFLVEHQRNPSRLLPLHFIKYQAALIENFLQGKPKATPWPLIFCACFYHGARSPYPYSNNTYDYFADTELAKDMNTILQFWMIDLTLLDDTTIQQHGSLALMEKIFKYSSKRKDFYYLIPELLKENKALLDRSDNNPLGPEYWHGVYLVVNRAFQQQGYGKEAAAELFSELINIPKNEIMTVTQAIRHEGMQQGMQQEKIYIAKNMFSRGFTPNLIQELSGISAEELRQLEKEYIKSKES